MAFSEKIQHFILFSTIQLKIFSVQIQVPPPFFLPADYFDIDDCKTGWVSFKKYFTLIKSYCEQNKTKLLFVIIPTLTNLGSDYPYKELQDKVITFVRSSNTKYYDLLPAFSDYNASELWVSSRNKHWNDKATSIAAEELSAFIIANKLLSNE